MSGSGFAVNSIDVISQLIKLSPVISTEISGGDPKLKGPAKSFNSAVKESEDLDFTITSPKLLAHSKPEAPLSKPKAVAFIANSANVVWW